MLAPGANDVSLLLATHHRTTLLQRQSERLADSENSHHVKAFYEHHSDDRGDQRTHREDGASNVLLADVGVETPTWEPLARTGTHNPRKR